MTKKEAIEYNKNLRMYMKLADKNQPCKFLEENYIALDMAIKALEQSCEECVDRKAVDELCFRFLKSNSEDVCAFYKHFLELFPSISQQKIGYWIADLQTATEDYYVCSECGRKVHLLHPDTISNYPYCHCGAKMQKE